MDMILAQYEDPHRQEAARKTVPVDKLEEKAIVALARVRSPIFNLQDCIYQEKKKKEKQPWKLPYPMNPKSKLRRVCTSLLLDFEKCFSYISGNSKFIASTLTA